MNKLNALFLIFVLFASTIAFGQDNVGIGTTTPDPTAALEIQSNDKGVLVPRLTTAQRTGIASPAEGLMVYDTDEECFFYYKASTHWESLCTVATPPSGTHNTLNDAYNEGGPGAGRVITANNGSVTINGSGDGASNIGLLVNHDGENTAGLGVNFSGTGNAIQAVSTNDGNTFATIQASTNSTTATNSALFGQSTGAARAVTGQVESSATSFAAVYGNNLRTNGGVGVQGAGYSGVAGESSYADGFGVFGENFALGTDLFTAPAAGVYGQAELGVGVKGVGDIGVAGLALAGGLAGIFMGDVEFYGDLYATGSGNFNLSDKRLKSNIVNIDSSLDKIMQLNAKHYTIKTKSAVSNIDNSSVVVENTREEYGLIAQELEMVFPQMVKEKAVFKSLGDDTMYKTVNYTQLIPIAIEAIKELNNKVEELERKVNSLESQLKNR